jgi:hypothetical protein
VALAAVGVVFWIPAGADAEYEPPATNVINDGFHTR